MVQKKTRIIIVFILLLAAPAALHAQTFELNQNNNSSSTGKKKQKKNTQPASTPDTQAPSTGIGWGSGIEIARNSHAAQQALEKGNYRKAAGYASRAAHEAPQNASLWFLWG